MADSDINDNDQTHNEPEVILELNNIPIEEREESDDEDEEKLDPNTLSKEGASENVRLKSAARFLLTLRHVCGVNQTHMKDVIQETQKLIDFVYDETVKKFSELGCVLPASVNVRDVKQEVCDVFKQLQTHHLQQKHFKETYKVITPMSINISSKFKKIGEGKNRKVVVVENGFYYIPILSVLEQMLKHPDFEKITTRQVNPNPEVLDCYTKGELAKKNPFLMQHPNALRVKLYWDEVETCMALSPHASGNQKLGVLNCTLDNIDPKYQGNLDTVCLVALATVPFVKEHGINVVLNRPLEDLKKLEKGVLLNEKIVFGTLIAVEGDNLGSHDIGGFKCGFTAHKPCRYCTATLEEVRSGLEIQMPMMRTPDEYDQQVAEVEMARTQKIRDAKSTEYGINRRCVLNELSTYHVIGGLPPDPMHDVLEGSLSRGVKHIIKHCVVDLNLTILDWLNSALADFDYGYSEISQKPSTIKNDHLKDEGNLHQSSSQMWVLATILSLILGPLMDEEDGKWQHFINLLEICRMIFSQEIKRNQLPYLSDRIISYQKGYIILWTSKAQGSFSWPLSLFVDSVWLFG